MALWEKKKYEINYQISSTKSQINHKSQNPITKTRTGHPSNIFPSPGPRIVISLSVFEDWLVVLNFEFV